MHEVVGVGGGRWVDPLDALARQHDVLVVTIVVHDMVLARAIAARTPFRALV